MKPPTLLDYSRYRDYRELVDALFQLQAKFAELIQLDVIGESNEGRKIYAVTVTDTSTGCADDKPALYLDGNIHAGEVTTSAFALYLIGYLAENYGQSSTVKKLLEGRTLYLVPRIAVDGADVYLKTPYYVRSSTRDQEGWRQQPGIDPQDLNGDGLITLMRVPHPYGEWKVSETDPRVMVRRKPGDLDGDYYKVYPEGRVKRESDLDPIEVRFIPGDSSPRWPLDLNRHYPMGWSPSQGGVSDVPLSEPETQAQVKFILDRPNIVATVALHTAGGVILNPLPRPPAEGFSDSDLHLFVRLGDLLEEHTGYPLLCKQNDTNTVSGHFSDWSYHHLGCVSLLIEMWNVAHAAGVDLPRNRAEGSCEHMTEETEVRMLQWVDEALGGDGFVDWVYYDHPDLGPVEIGGWDLKFTRHNPPLRYVEEELAKNVPFMLDMMAALPQLAFGRTRMTPVSKGVLQIELQVQNAGYLPTHVTEKALDLGKAQPVMVSLEPSVGEVLGAREVDLGHLDGRSIHGDQQGWTGYYIYGSPVPEFERVAEWTVRLDKGRFKGEVTAETPRGGRVQMKIAWPD